ncbi:transport and Golgi organization protein 2 [Contarinia nasturtii]|uniref:transport and Golgi organization protein 2 n=1 Tax=Contarinia nasturtii TaxID=265458 RepID=UPI0012D4946A|nr:transport and Golgi organization protein 2 [Contarinia nasturtii]XP_031626639.1 transport and Golgi organization protein 2 [Contarinia nasturtii]XP_031626640.1 transport and Golgi organization protein 2 [Contarinia nasturtii]
MCILFFILNKFPKADQYKLILAANRDEYYARPASVAERWKECDFVIGGRDLEPGREGGTWLAISTGTKDKTFKFGSLLNITGEPIDENALHRGNLVVDYVKNPISNVEYCQNLIDTDKKFNSFNLITIEIGAEINRTVHYSNVNNVVQEWPCNEPLAFGNSLSHEPYEKVKAGREKFREIINRENQSKDDLVNSLKNFLCDREKHWPDEVLNRRVSKWADKLSSICVRHDGANYGTRTRTIILIDGNNKVDFYEETMTSTNPDDAWTRTHIQTEF